MLRSVPVGGAAHPGGEGPVAGQADLRQGLQPLRRQGCSLDSLFDFEKYPNVQKCCLDLRTK